MGRIKAPFPYFGGKSRVAGDIWQRLGHDVRNYVEPFAGSSAVLLARDPAAIGIETLNDVDGFVANFWRATAADPEAVARWADWPVSEYDLHARHSWLVLHRDWIEARLRSDPHAYDARMAGWWVWGLCAWIGYGWCAGRFHRQRPYLASAGMGLDRKVPHSGDAGRGLSRQLPHLGNAGMGLNRKLPHLGNAERGLPGPRRLAYILAQLAGLAARLRDVRIAAGDWRRVLGPAVTTCNGMTAVFLDPPYPKGERSTVYARDSDVFYDVAAWVEEHWDDPGLRIALCGYCGTWNPPPGGEVWRWKAAGGYGSRAAKRGRKNAGRETIWFSPACLRRSPGR